VLAEESVRIFDLPNFENPALEIYGRPVKGWPKM
jgi:hypothetical protein